MGLKFGSLKQLAVRRLKESKETCFLVPARLFWVTHVEAPEGKLREKNLEEIARLAIEEGSPFELSELLWGVLPYASGKGLLVYATAKSVLERECPGAVSSAYMFPSFIPCFLGEGLPAGVCGCCYGEERFAFALNSKGFWEDFVVWKDGGEFSPAKVLELSHVMLHHKGISFVCRPGGDAQESVVNLLFGSPFFWTANLHDSDLHLKRRKEKKIEACCYRMTLASSFLMIGLFIAWTGLEFNFWRLRRDSNFLAAEDPWVARVKQKQDLLEELALFSKQKQLYFRILTRLNDVRPESIIFARLKADNGRKFEIEGTAQKVDDVHRYVGKLQEDVTFVVLDLRRITSRNNEVKFSLYVEFEERA